MGRQLCSDVRDLQAPLSGPCFLLTSLRCAVWILCRGALSNLYHSFGIFAIHSSRFSVHTSEKEGLRKHPSQTELTVSCIARLGKDSKELVGKCCLMRMSFGGFIFPPCSLRDHFLTTSSCPALETYLTEPCVWVSWDSFGFPLLWSQMNGCSLRWFSRVSVAELFLPALPFPECYWSPGGNIILRDKSCHLYALFCSVGVSDHLLAGESCKQLCVLQWNHTEPEGVRRTVGSDAKGNLAFLPHPPRVGQSGKATRF